MEEREVVVFDGFCNWQKDIAIEWNNHIKQIILVRRTRRTFDHRLKGEKISVDESFYISALQEEAKFYNKAIREHWGIENSNHSVRDNSFGEDKSRIRTKPILFAILRTIALNIMRINKVNNITQERFDNLCSYNKIFKYSII